MGTWLLGIAAAGMLVGLGLGRAMRPTAALGWAGSLGIAAMGALLAVLFAWPAWKLGAWLGPHFDLSETTGGAAFACIFGLGGAALTGVIHAARRTDDDGA